MPQLHFYVPEETAKVLRARARARGLPVSQYLATVVKQNLGQAWPADFFDKVVGGWQGEPLKRPRQGSAEKREKF